MARAIRTTIFDVDGVILDTPHEIAWREVLADFADPSGFTTAFYQAHVAGKPRLEGARAALELLGEGDAAAHADEYARKKQARVDELIEAGRFSAFPDAVRLTLALEKAGIRMALASSSRNVDRMLERIVLPDGRAFRSLFGADLSGLDIPRGKPDPSLFLLAAKAIGSPPEDCMVVEDAPAGIQAARAGAMASLGIARLGDEALLREAGADLVLSTLDALDVAALGSGTLRSRKP